MAFDYDKFRLRSFVDRLRVLDELEVHEEPVALSALTGIIESSRKAVLFRNAGPERYEIIAGVTGSRRRVAAAFGVDERGLLPEFQRRLRTPQSVVEVNSKEAPVHQQVFTGEEIDLSKLPFYLQHQLDGAPYISSAVDFTIDPATGKPNVGCRRLMLKSRTELRSNLTQPSDLRRIYVASVERKERLPVCFFIGTHPLDFLAATLKVPTDELQLLAALRGETMPLVRGVTNGIPVPADAEMVLEGYFDELGYSELEGPYGELYGYYGPMHPDPVFHVTAITRRRDMIHHSVLHGGRFISRNEASHLSALNSEANVWRTLKEAGIDVVDVHSLPGATGIHHVRVAIRQKAAGEARRAIGLLFKLPLLRLIFVVDHDIDIRSQEDMDWAMCTRFKVDRDVITEGGHFALSMDPTIGEDGKMTKGGFDMTARFAAPDSIESRISDAPVLRPVDRPRAVRDTLQSGPKFFAELMEAAGTDDGRQVALELDELRRNGLLTRLDNGQWCLKGQGGKS